MAAKAFKNIIRESSITVMKNFPTKFISVGENRLRNLRATKTRNKKKVRMGKEEREQGVEREKVRASLSAKKGVVSPGLSTLIILREIFNSLP